VSKSQCVWKLHSACINHTRACRYHTHDCHIHTHTCQNYSHVSGNYTLRVKLYSACGNRSLRVEINLVRVEITFVRVVISDFFFFFGEGGGYYPITPTMDPRLR
jgi:hypothetical protein